MRRNRKKCITILLLILMTFSICSCSDNLNIFSRVKNKVISTVENVVDEYNDNSKKEKAEFRLGDIKLPDDAEITLEDDFVPMVPDGYEKITIKLPKVYEFEKKIKGTWRKYPLSKDADKIINGYHENNSDYGTKVDGFIPSNIKRGYYKIITYDNKNMSESEMEESILSNVSQEYAVMAYDLDLNVIYTYYLSW